MARITIEDGLKRIPNHYELTLLAAKRARQLLAGLPPMIDPEPGEKPVVTALREIAAGKIDWETVEKLEEQRRQVAEAEAASV
ncbi:MAG: DNA-directed RNA polymerase subunit omega [Zetaproteobacteria bacterium]|nr:MAG: DNA-directed RNA polymerase subunit omega [Zetaproteobacteria bacterium]